MNKIKRSTAAKAVALILLAVFIPTALLGGIAVGVLANRAAYSEECLEQMLGGVIGFDLEELSDENLYFDEEAQKEFQMKFAPDRCDTMVTVEKDGEVLLSNYDGEAYPEVELRYTVSFGAGEKEWAFAYTQGHDNPLDEIEHTVIRWNVQSNQTFGEWLLEKYGINTYGMSDEDILEEYGEAFTAQYNTDIHTSTELVKATRHCNITLCRAADSVERFSDDHIMLLAYRMRWTLVGILAGAVLLGTALFAFLCKAAGWRKDGDQPTGTWRERMPLGVFLAVSAPVLVLLFALAEEALNCLEGDLLSILGFAGAGFLFTLAAAGVVHSLVARFKMKDWRKHTILYALYRGARWLLSNLPDLWQAVLCVAGWLVGNLIFTIVLFHEPELGIILLALFNLAAAAGVIAVAAQWRKLSKAAQAIASGDTGAKVDTDRMLPALRDHGQRLNSIGEGVAAAVEERMRSERMKTDLITNVSHDLKTPLTSIVSYVGLLKGETIDNPAAREYIDILDRQAVRLGRLIEDLVEASKVTSGSVTPDLAPVNVGELLEQAVSEYHDRLTSASLIPVLTVHGGELTAHADGRLLWRVFDNLLSNACKYAMPGTRLYIDAAEREDAIGISFRNISAVELNIPAEELMERFVRGDSSRSTPGNGLGLTIARSLTELQGGTFGLSIDGDLFKALVTVPAGDRPQPEEEEVFTDEGLIPAAEAPVSAEETDDWEADLLLPPGDLFADETAEPEGEMPILTAEAEDLEPNG